MKIRQIVLAGELGDVRLTRRDSDILVEQQRPSNQAVWDIQSKLQPNHETLSTEVWSRVLHLIFGRTTIGYGLVPNCTGSDGREIVDIVGYLI